MHTSPETASYTSISLRVAEAVQEGGHRANVERMRPSQAVIEDARDLVNITRMYERGSERHVEQFSIAMQYACSLTSSTRNRDGPCTARLMNVLYSASFSVGDAGGHVRIRTLDDSPSSSRTSAARRGRGCCGPKVHV